MWTVFVTCLAFLGSGIWALWFGHKENTDSAKPGFAVSGHTSAGRRW
jgi:hypothetical protein